MLVKELKELLEQYSEYMPVLIDVDGHIMDISRTERRANVDEYNRIIAEEFEDPEFDKKEASLIISTF